MAWTSKDQRSRLGRLAGSIVAMAAILAACAPPPTAPPADPAPPVIASFVAQAQRTVAPVTAVFSWNISDVNNDFLICRVDTDGNGTYDTTINGCTSSKLAMANYLTAGTRTARLEVSDGVFPPVTATTTVPVTAGPSEPFNITLRIDSPMKPEFQAAFRHAAAKWESVIVAGNPDQYAQIQPILFPWTPAFDGVIDDVLIDARDAQLDGPGNLLGQATPQVLVELAGIIGQVLGWDAERQAEEIRAALPPRITNDA